LARHIVALGAAAALTAHAVPSAHDRRRPAAICVDIDTDPKLIHRRQPARHPPCAFFVIRSRLPAASSRSASPPR
jgi:hypothetical protein